MVVAAAIFGANYVVGRAVDGEVPPYLLGFVRWTGATLILLPFTWRRITGQWGLVRANRWLLLLAGCLMPFMGAGLTYVALTRTIALNGGIVQTSLPIFIALLAWIFLRERLTARVAAGAAVAMAGVVAIVSRGNPSLLLGLTVNPGDAILVFCNLSLAGYAIAMRRLPGGFHPMTVLTVVCAIGAACHAPFMVAEFVNGEMARATLVAAGGLVFVAIFPSVIAIACWNHGIARLGPTGAGIYMYLVPVFSAVGAWAFLGETVQPYHLVGGILIVAGVTVASRRKAGAGAHAMRSSSASK